MKDNPVDHSRWIVIASALALGACSSEDAPKTDADYRTEVVQGMHDTLVSDIRALNQASKDLQAAAPTPSDRGWSATDDAEAIRKMTDAWLAARRAYERTEGAIAPLFPDIDAAIDARYEDFLAEIGPGGDQNLFDGDGVTGMHAVERILFAQSIPAAVTQTEATLPGYKVAAWPETAEQAAAFKNALVGRLITDTATLLEQWEPQHIDLGGTYQGLVALMNEQREKVAKAASSEEESRYAQRTMADIRDNLAGTRAVYALFQPWLLTKSGGKDVNRAIEGSFDKLEAVYETVSGDAIPQPPATWSSENPTDADRATPFGKLFSAVYQAVDPNVPDSAVDGMNRAAKELGFPEFAE